MKPYWALSKITLKHKTNSNMKKTLLLFVMLTSVVGFYSHASNELPIEYFVKRSDYLDLKISPDGKHYAARVRDDKMVYLLIIRLSDGEIVGGVKPGADNEVASVMWANNERLIYTFAEKSRRYDSAGYTGELFAVNIDSSKNKLLAGYRADDAETGRRIHHQKSARATHYVLNTLPDKERKVLIIEHPWTLDGYSFYDYRRRPPIVSELDIFTGKKSNKETIPYPGARVFADDSGNVKFLTWRDQEDVVKAFYRENRKADWQDITEAFGDHLDDFHAVGINKTGTKVFLEGKLDQDPAETVYEFDLSTKNLVKLFEPNVDLYGWELDENDEPIVGISFPNDAVYHYAKGKESSAMVKMHKSLNKAFKGQRIWFANQTDDGSKLTFKVYSSTNPGEYYAYDTNTKKADFLWANYSWIDPRLMLPKLSFTAKAEDGTPLNGYITLPKVQKEGVLPPLVVLPHGGPHGVRDYPFFDSEAQLLAGRGYAVLQINFRGSDGYTQEFREAGYKQWGGLMIEDIVSATRQAVSRGLVDGNRMCIYGASYGGFAALQAAVKAPDLFKCTAGYVGVYDLEMMMSKGDIPKRFSGPGYLKRVLGADQEQLKKFSPVNHVDQIKADVLLIHGDEDIRVPSDHAKVMRKALKKVGKEPKWLYLGNVGHGAVSMENRLKVYQTLLEFLDKNIGASSLQH